MDEIVREEFHAQHCKTKGVQQGSIDFTRFRRKMYDTYPQRRNELKIALSRFIKEQSYTFCDSFPKDDQGRFLNAEAALAHLKSMRSDLDMSGLVPIWDRIRARNAAAAAAAASNAASSTAKTRDPANKEASAKVATAQLSQSIRAPPAVLKQSIQPVHQPLAILQVIPEKSTQVVSLAPSAHPLQTNSTLGAPLPFKITHPVSDDILAKKLKQLQLFTEKSQPEAKAIALTSVHIPGPDFSVIGKLLKIQEANAATSVEPSAMERSIRQAPLLAASIVAEHYKDFVQQYGLLGSLEEKTHKPGNPQLFLNTNVPFSAFVCGVQGSGKSHTVSCILENAILASSNLGHLKSPVSTLVFSYGEWCSGGAGFNISEATFLGGSHQDFPDHHVQRVTVLYSPSNPAIKRVYERLPNVVMVPFRLKARTLDIGALRSLMAVDEKSTTPLYMATVEAILRDIASNSADGSMDYLEFKRRLTEERFDSTQTNMLNMRMNLLESFLDLDGTSPVPDFKPGEITIIDLSDPFLTPSTACMLFKIGLEQFLQSGAPGKMVVLDEAHKYMLDTPGSNILTEYLTRLIRLQRHQGARVVISTQEPTIATELIALCSVTIMHRFTSPNWYAALKKHINAVENDKDIMQRIESLDTGEALVYSPNSVLGKNEDGSLVKAIGRLMRVHIRNRVTLDGGASIMAV